MDGISKLEITIIKRTSAYQLANHDSSSVAFNCPVEACGSTFRQAKDLNVHQATAHQHGDSEGLWICNTCADRRYLYWRDLVVHIRNNHLCKFCKSINLNGCDEHGLPAPIPH